MTLELTGRSLVPGRGAGPAMVLGGPLSMWGGLDPESGEIIDRRHPQSGEIVTGRVLVLPFGRGSSCSSAVLLEAVRLETAPAAVCLLEIDPILALGATVARELYDAGPPIVLLEEADYRRIETGMELTLDPSGRVIVERAS